MQIEQRRGKWCQRTKRFINIFRMRLDAYGRRRQPVTYFETQGISYSEKYSVKIIKNNLQENHNHNNYNINF